MQKGACKDVLETFSLRDGNGEQEMVNSEIHQKERKKGRSKCCDSLDSLFSLFSISVLAK